MIFISGVVTGIIFSGFHVSKALKLLAFNKIAEGYGQVQQACKTNNPVLIAWESGHFNLLLDKIENYKIISDTEFYFYKFIVYALLYRYSDISENSRERLSYQKTMLDYFELYSKTRNKPLDRQEIDSFITRMLERWKNEVTEPEKINSPATGSSRREQNPSGSDSTCSGTTNEASRAIGNA